jgi:hypothetical protein
MTDTFTCDRCHQTFDKVRPEEEVVKEYHAIFEDDASDERSVLCTKCFSAFMNWYMTEGKKL